MPRLPTDREFQARFSEYVRSIGGECVDDLIPPRASGPKMADYLLWQRAMVVEMKCITTDLAPHQLEVLDQVGQYDDADRLNELQALEVKLKVAALRVALIVHHLPDEVLHRLGIELVRQQYVPLLREQDFPDQPSPPWR